MLLLEKNSNISYCEYFQVFLSNKTNLFLALSLVFISIIAYPLILPHISHPSMIYHIGIHIASFDVALFLTLISVWSFKKTKSKRVLLTSLSFGTLLVVEFLYLLQSSNVLGEYHLPYIGVEAPHILLLFMLVFFAVGVARVEKRW
jgi:hypothetical protein